ncbi:MAG: MFS transporter [Brevibacillus sp.]|nr:MFS transporter [Brevibacillus sp.]
MEKNITTTSYLELLKGNRSFRKLFISQTISVLGDWFNTIALLGLVYSTTKSGFMVSLTLIARALPSLLLSPFAGVMVDRHDKRKMMVAADLSRSVFALGLIFAENHIGFIFTLNVLLSISGAFFIPARQSVIPSIVKKNQLSTANALSSTVLGVMGIVGASFGGIVSEVISYKVAFIFNSLSFIVSAFFIWTAKLPVIHRDSKKRSTFMQDLQDGYIFIRKTPLIFALISVGISWGIVGGAYQVLLTIYASDVFGAGDMGIGILYSIQGLGIIIGSVVVAKIVKDNNERMKRFFGWSYFVQGVFFLLFILSTNIYLGVVFLLGMRIAGGIIIPLDTTLIQRYTPQAVLGKVFALHGSIFTSVMQISMFLTGILLEVMSPQIVGGIFGIICVITSCIFLLMFYTNKLAADEEKTLNY